MKNLLIYNPIYFKGLENKEDFAAWRAMYGVTLAITAPYIDRTGVIQFPIKTDIPQENIMPEFDNNFNLSYSDCGMKQAEKIYNDAESKNLPIYIFWSGGIDSSMVLVSFIEFKGLDYARKRIKIVLTPESIIENPYMYYDFILPYFDIISGEHIDSIMSKDKIIVTGELNDQLIGSDVMRDFISFKGTTDTFTSWKESEIERYFYQHKKMPEHHASIWANILSTCVRSAQCPVYDYWDFFWYITFSCKWMYVKHRLLVYADPKSVEYESYQEFDFYQRAFYDSVEFQQWSMNNPDKKHQNSWDSHKWFPRKLVSEFLKRPEYLKKLKNGSLWNLAVSKHRANAIDCDLNMYETIDTIQWYEENNSFKR